MYRSIRTLAACCGIIAGAASAIEGMFTPGQLSGIVGGLRSAGLQLEPSELADLTVFPMAAVISLGGCTASFVSPHGLVVTNHHCARSSVQFHSNSRNNYRKRKINPTPALRQNLCASGVGIPLPLTDQENLGYDLIRKGWENGSQRLTRRAVEISRARIIGQIRESGYVERKGDRDVPCFFRFCRNDPRRRPPCREAVQRQSPLVRWRCGSRSDRYVPRQQRFDLFHAAGPGQLGEHLTQILIGLQSIGLGGLHQAVEVGAGLDPLYAVAEQPVFAAHDKGTDRVFGQVVVDGDSPVVQITDQPGPFVLQVVERLADGGFRWRLRQCLV